MKSILIVDDEKNIRDVISSYLIKEGFKTYEAETGRHAVNAIEEKNIHLVILDLMLPDMSGEDVCSRVRKLSPVPILMLTAKLTEEDRVLGLSIGADDYMTKPFSPRELVARVKAILRRSDQELLADRISYNNGDIVVDALQCHVFKNGYNVNVTTIEYKVLTKLFRNPKRVFSREELIEKVFGLEYPGETRTIDQHIKNLRQKIENDPKNPDYITTVRGIGYMFTGGKND